MKVLTSLFVMLAGFAAKAELCDSLKEFRVNTEAPIFLQTAGNSIELAPKSADVFANHDDPAMFYELTFVTEDRSVAILVTGHPSNLAQPRGTVGMMMPMTAENCQP